MGKEKIGRIKESVRKHKEEKGELKRKQFDILGKKKADT